MQWLCKVRKPRTDERIISTTDLAWNLSCNMSFKCLKRAARGSSNFVCFILHNTSWTVRVRETVNLPNNFTDMPYPKKCKDRILQSRLICSGKWLCLVRVSRLTLNISETCLMEALNCGEEIMAKRRPLVMSGPSLQNSFLVYFVHFSTTLSPNAAQ